MRSTQKVDCIDRYISFIVAGRNDSYGGDFLSRLQVFVDNLTALLTRYDLSSELLIVEWNPPMDRARLRNALTWRRWLRPGMIRIVEVPNEIHKRLFGSRQEPYPEFVAKNVGIRRARGEYVVPTNADCLYSEELIEFLASRRLSPDCFYRADRYDVDATVSIQEVDEQLDFCLRHVSRVNVLGGSVDLHRPPIGLDKLGLAMRLCTHKIHSYIRQNPRLEDRLYTNACGDFLLMLRSNWHVLRGYPEQLAGNAHIDSYLLVMAASAGLRQVILPTQMRVYHQEHKRPISRIGYDEWVREASEMLKTRTPRIFNDENWGLGDTVLKEYLPERGLS